MKQRKNEIRFRIVNSMVGFVAVCGACGGAGLAYADLTLSDPVYTWTNSATGNWTNTINWKDGGVADAVGAVVDFTQADLQGDSLIALSNDVTVGSMFFGKTSGMGTWFRIEGSGALTLETVDEKPRIDVNDTIEGVSFLNPIQGTSGFLKTGQGKISMDIVKLTGLSGATIIDGGSLEVWSSAFGEYSIGSSLTVNPGCEFELLKSDIIDNDMPITLNGGTLNMFQYTEYINTLTMSSNALVKAKEGSVGGVLIYDSVTPHIYAKGGGFAGDIQAKLYIGTKNGPFGVESGTREQQVDVEENTSLMISSSVEDKSSGNEFTHGALRKTGTGELILSKSASTYVMPTTVEAGTLTLTNGVILQSVVTLPNENGTLHLADDVFIGGLTLSANARPVALNGYRLCIGNLNAQEGVLDSAITGDGEVWKYGSNIQFIRSPQTFSRLTVSSGTLKSGMSSSFPLTGYTFDSQMNIGAAYGRKPISLTSVNSRVSFSSEGRHGGAVSIRGDDYFQGDASLLPKGNAAHTVCLWVKTNYGYSGFFGFGTYTAGNCSGFGLQGNSLNFYTWGKDLMSPGNVQYSNGEWWHFAVVYDPTLVTENRKIYANGVQVASDNYKELNIINNVFEVGRTAKSDSRRLSGTMDEFLIFDRALSATEINAIYTDRQHSGSACLVDSIVPRVDGKGTLNIGSESQVIAGIQGNGTLSLDNSAVTISGTVTSFIGAVSGSGTLNKTGTAGLLIGNLSGFSGRLNVTGGNVGIAGNSISVFETNIVARYTFDSAETPFADESGNGYTLTSQGGASHLASGGYIGGCALFTGNGLLNPVEDVFPSKIPTGNKPFTVSFMMKVDPKSGSRAGFYSWGVKSSSQMNGMRLGDPTTADRYSLTHYFWGKDLGGTNEMTWFEPRSNDRWYHILTTYEPNGPEGTSYRRIYINGVLAASDTFSATMNVQPQEFRIGGSACNGGYDYFKGCIDEFTVLDCSVDDTGIMTLKNGMRNNTDSHVTAFVSENASMTFYPGRHVLSGLDATGGVTVVSGAELVATNGASYTLRGSLDGGGSVYISNTATGILENVTGTGRLVVEDGGMFTGRSNVLDAVMLEEGAVLMPMISRDPVLTVSNSVSLPVRATLVVDVTDLKLGTKCVLLTGSAISGSTAAWTVRLIGAKNNTSIFWKQTQRELSFFYGRRGMVIMLK